MTYDQKLTDYQQDLKQVKKEYDKKCKELKKARSSYQAEILREEVEELRQDIICLQISINEIKQGKPLHECDTTQFVY